MRGGKLEDALPIDTIVKHIPFCPQAAFIKTKVQKELMFDTQFKISADFDFFLRAYLCGKTFYKIDETIAVFNFGGISNRNLIKTYDDDTAVKVKNGLEKKNSLKRKLKRLRFIIKNKIKKQ